MKLEHGACDLKRLVKELTDMVGHRAAEKNLILRVVESLRNFHGLREQTRRSCVSAYQSPRQRGQVYRAWDRHPAIELQIS